VVVVTGASRGPAATLVAANLAAAFARTGSETVLLSARLPDTLGDAAPVTTMFDVAAKPGLSEVLTGRADLTEALQRAPRTPWLRVITTGGTASAGGLLQSQSLRDLMLALRAQAGYVVIEAPSTASSADAQSLASLADAAIVAVELRRTTYTQVLDAVEQLRRVGTPVLGSVAMARLARARLDPARLARPRADPDRVGGSGADRAAPSAPTPRAGLPKRLDPPKRLDLERLAGLERVEEIEWVEPVDQPEPVERVEPVERAEALERIESVRVDRVRVDDTDPRPVLAHLTTRGPNGRGQATGIMAALTEDGLDAPR
jgi:hypothetical protein